MEDEQRGTVYHDGGSEYASSMNHLATPRHSHYGGYN